MQKHERIVLTTVKEILEPEGYTIDTRRNGHAKMVVMARRNNRTQSYQVCSTPRCADHEKAYAVQWARRVIRGQ